MTVDIDVIVERHATDAPFGIDERFLGQRRQRRPVQFVERLSAADAELAHRPGVQVGDEHRDRGVQLGQREEALVAQPRQDPALTTRTPASTFALSRGRRIRVGRIAVR